MVTKRRNAAAPTPSVPALTTAKNADSLNADSVPFSVHARRLATITACVAVPYGAYLGYHFVHLQSGLLRPAVAADGARQMLIVGTQSSGTTEMARRLQSLGLEVAHESSDTQWSFARDGTISWLHALRFLPGQVTDAQLRALCGAFDQNMGFHPAMFRVPRRGCSYRSKWDQCWASECVDLVRAEWGCARAAASSAQSCEAPYMRSLLQVRHPLRVVESLCVKFCASLSSTPHAAARRLLGALWPGARWADFGCARTFGWFWTLYNEAMLAALADGVLHSWYRVEDTPDACTVAHAAGLLNADTAIDVLHAHKAAARHCSVDGRSHWPLPKRDKNQNKRNQGQVSLRLADIAGADAELEARMRALAATLGYDKLE